MDADGLWIDAAIGETREVIIRDGRAVMLRVSRWSDAGRRARWGEVYAGRVTAADPRLRGAFVDLGLKDEQGFLPFGAKRPDAVREGALLSFEVAREGARGKGPVLRLRDSPVQADRPGRVAIPECDEEPASPASPDVREQIDALIEANLEPTAPIPGGGVLTIQPTAALVAIDVDAAGRTGERDPERFALSLNQAAAGEALRQLKLRGLGGIVAIDFVTMRARASQTALEDMVKAAVADDPWGLQVARLSRFGVMELSRGQLRRPLHEIMNDIDGRPSAETVALRALRAVEAAHHAQRGRVIQLRTSPEVAAWLNSDVIAWREALVSWIGTRWTLAAEAGYARDRFDVSAP